MITKLSGIMPKTKKKLAVAYAQDPNTIEAIAKAVNNNICSAFMVGDKEQIIKVATEKNIDPKIFDIVHQPNAVLAAKKAVELVKTGKADVLMKGLCSTAVYLKAVLDKEKGLLPQGNIMSHVTVIEVPTYNKLLFLTDVAVLPNPDLKQKTAMINYAVKVASKFGIEQPKVALLAAVEKVNPKMGNTIEAALLSKMNDRGQIKNAVIDGPLDVFLACDPASIEIKGVETPINGEADVLVFPDIQAANMFYKGLMLFAKGELAALLQGTEKPVIVTSRSESTLSKYYSIAFGCLMAE